MSVTSALYTGISGLNANGEAMSVIGNNISNVNTIGFKQGRMLFSDVLSSTISGGSQIGRGVQIQTVENQFTQGSFESTESGTDLAIQGDSFFVVQNTSGRYYTRAGAFSFNKDKTLVNPEGYQVMGYGIIPSSGLSDGVLKPIDLTNFATTPPKQTSTVKFVVNLDSTQTTPTLAWDPANPVATSNYSTSLSVYDSQGNAHTATVYFRKTADNAWDWHVILPDAAAGTPGSTTTPHRRDPHLRCHRSPHRPDSPGRRGPEHHLRGRRHRTPADLLRPGSRRYHPVRQLVGGFFPDPGRLLPGHPHQGNHR